MDVRAVAAASDAVTGTGAGAGAGAGGGEREEAARAEGTELRRNAARAPALWLAVTLRDRDAEWICGAPLAMRTTLNTPMSYIEKCPDLVAWQYSARHSTPSYFRPVPRPEPGTEDGHRVAVRLVPLTYSVQSRPHVAHTLRERERREREEQREVARLATAEAAGAGARSGRKDRKKVGDAKVPAVDRAVKNTDGVPELVLRSQADLLERLLATQVPRMDLESIRRAFKYSHSDSTRHCFWCYITANLELWSAVLPVCSSRTHALPGRGEGAVLVIRNNGVRNLYSEGCYEVGDGEHVTRDQALDAMCTASSQSALGGRAVPRCYFADVVLRGPPGMEAAAPQSQSEQDGEYYLYEAPPVQFWVWQEGAGAPTELSPKMRRPLGTPPGVRPGSGHWVRAMQQLDPWLCSSLRSPDPYSTAVTISVVERLAHVPPDPTLLRGSSGVRALHTMLHACRAVSALIKAPYAHVTDIKPSNMGSTRARGGGPRVSAAAEAESSSLRLLDLDYGAQTYGYEAYSNLPDVEKVVMALLAVAHGPDSPQRSGLPLAHEFPDGLLGLLLAASERGAWDARVTWGVARALNVIRTAVWAGEGDTAHAREPVFQAFEQATMALEDERAVGRSVDAYCAALPMPVPKVTRLGRARWREHLVRIRQRYNPATAGLERSHIVQYCRRARREEERAFRDLADELRGRWDRRCRQLAAALATRPGAPRGWFARKREERRCYVAQRAVLERARRALEHWRSKDEREPLNAATNASLDPARPTSSQESVSQSDGACAETGAGAGAGASAIAPARSQQLDEDTALSRQCRDIVVAYYAAKTELADRGEQGWQLKDWKDVPAAQRVNEWRERQHVAREDILSQTLHVLDATERRLRESRVGGGRETQCVSCSAQ